MENRTITTGLVARWAAALGLWLPVWAHAVGAPDAPGPAANGAKPAAAIVMKPVTLTDPGMGGMESHTVLVPAGWKAQGGRVVAWR